MPVNPIGYALRNRRAGHHTLVWARDDMQAPSSITLTSPAFDDGQPIPSKHRGRIFAPNISPALAWSAPPAGTRELVLLVEDPDVPVGKPATHALVIGLGPAVREIPENGLSARNGIVGVKYGRSAVGRTGWAGPLPPRSHGVHSYVFQLYALDTALELPARFGLAQVVAAMGGHVIARGRLEGTYEVA